jgi:hypothetical protein
MADVAAELLTLPGTDAVLLVDALITVDSGIPAVDAVMLCADAGITIVEAVMFKYHSNNKSYQDL